MYSSMYFNMYVHVTNMWGGGCIYLPQSPRIITEIYVQSTDCLIDCKYLDGETAQVNMDPDARL